MGNTFYFEWEVRLMEWLQCGMGSVGAIIAQILTACGEELVLILLLGFVYWCYDKEFGKFVGVNIVVGLTWNPMLKNVVLRRRPYFDHSSIRCIRPAEPKADIMDISEQGFSFPSGHSTNGVIAYGSMPVYKKNKALTVLGIAMPLLIGLSRVMLGVHYPTDVLVGWLMGGIVVGLVSWLQKKVQRKWILHLVLFVTALPGMLYCKTSDYYTAVGLMAGLFFAIAFEEHYVHFENTRNPLECVIRIVGGFLVYFLVNTGLKLPFSKDFLASATTAAYMVRFVRYIIVGFVTLGVYPLVFSKIHLHSQKSEKGI